MGLKSFIHNLTADKSNNHIETKGATDFQNIFSANPDAVSGFYVSPNVLYWLYGISDTIQDAVNRIAWAFTDIKPMLKDKITGEYILEHPAIELFENTDMRFNQDQVKFEMMVSYCLTGEAYPVLVGNVKYEPVAFYHYPANNISIAQGSDGYIQTVIASYQNVVQTYNRAINKNYKSYVFETQDKLSQMAQVINNRKRNYLRAQSPLESVYYQAITKYYGNIHNSGLIRNAARPGGLWSPKDSNMAQNQYEAFKKEIKDNFTGSLNAGRNIVAPVPIEYQNFLINTRDMDFIKLITNSRTEIYSIYSIPLPLVEKDTMTMNNYSKAVEAFYDMAVLPRARHILKQVGSFILSRYKNGNRYEFTIDERCLGALKERAFTRAKDMRSISAFSENEIRSEVGYEAIDNGDEILRPATLLSSGDRDDYTFGNIVIDGQTITNDDITEEVHTNTEIIKDGDSESNQTLPINTEAGE